MSARDLTSVTVRAVGPRRLDAPLAQRAVYVRATDLCGARVAQGAVGVLRGHVAFARHAQPTGVNVEINVSA